MRSLQFASCASRLSLMDRKSMDARNAGVCVSAAAGAAAVADGASEDDEVGADADAVDVDDDIATIARCEKESLKTDGVLLKGGFLPPKKGDTEKGDTKRDDDDIVSGVYRQRIILPYRELTADDQKHKSECGNSVARNRPGSARQMSTEPEGRRNSKVELDKLGDPEAG